MVLHDGAIAEMKTGEGKTLTATLAVFLNSLAGDAGPPRHRQRLPGPPRRRVDGADLRRPRASASGVIQAGHEPAARRKLPYACDVVYGTNSEFGFDYLRDNMAASLEDCVQREHVFAIVDEVDNILIDEARTPLIISGAPEQAADPYYTFARLAKQMVGRAGEGEAEVARRGQGHLRGRLRLRVRREAQDRRPDRARRRQGRAVPRRRQPLRLRARHARQPPDPVAEGRVAVQARRRLRGDRRRGDDHRRVHRPHPRGPALVRGPAPGDRGQGGRPDPRGEPDARDDHAPELLPPLRQALRDDRHGAHRGAGVHEDLRDAGGRDPDQRADGPRRPQRPDLQDQGRQVEGGRRRDQRAPRAGPADPGRDDLGRGLGDALRRARPATGIDHVVLNAKPEHAQREGETIAQAGRIGAVTIATNMAGRGVDIKLGGDPEQMAQGRAAQARRLARTTRATRRSWPSSCPELEEQCEAEGEKVLEAGGLFICGTERHESRRIDNQLRGRSGRQGDPGESRFFLSAEDDLIRLFAGDRIYKILDRLGPGRRAGRGVPARGEDAHAARSRTRRRRSSSRTS